MSAKWSDAQREKFIRTMAVKRTARMQVEAAKAAAASLPARPRRRSPNEAEDFARFMAAAWRLYKGRGDGR